MKIFKKSRTADSGEYEASTEFERELRDLLKKHGYGGVCYNLVFQNLGKKFNLYNDISVYTGINERANITLNTFQAEGFKSKK